MVKYLIYSIAGELDKIFWKDQPRNKIFFKLSN